MEYKRYTSGLLIKAAELQEQKGKDYQSNTSTIKQGDYYLHGVNSILDTVNAKVLRARSVLSVMEAGGGENYESVQDSMLDLINYATFIIAYMDGEIDGQSEDRDIFNRRVNAETSPGLIPSKFKTRSE